MLKIAIVGTGIIVKSHLKGISHLDDVKSRPRGCYGRQYIGQAECSNSSVPEFFVTFLFAKIQQINEQAKNVAATRI